MNRIYNEEMRIISDVGFKLTFCEEIERFVSTTLEGDVGVSFSARAQSTTKGGKGRQKKKKKGKKRERKKTERPMELPSFVHLRCFQLRRKRKNL